MTQNTGPRPAAPTNAATRHLVLILSLAAIATALIVTQGGVITDIFAKKTAEDLLASQTWGGFWAKGFWTIVLIGGVYGLVNWTRGHKP
jgi:hypothetical protein